MDQGGSTWLEEESRLREPEKGLVEEMRFTETSAGVSPKIVGGERLNDVCGQCRMGRKLRVCLRN